MAIFYNVCFLISFLLSAFYVVRWKKYFDVNITILFFIIPLVNLGYVFLSMAGNLEEALLAQKLIYLGGCFMPFFIAYSIFGLTRVRTNPFVKLALFLTSAAFFGAVLSVGHTKLFYESVTFVEGPYGYYLEKTYGPVHTLFYIFIAAYFLLGIGTIIYVFSTKKKVSRVTTWLLVLPELFCVIGFFGSKAFFKGIELPPLTYIFAQTVYIFIVERISLYQPGLTVVETMVQKGDDGYITLDKAHHYLGSNETARRIIPELENLYIDEKIDSHKELSRTVLHWVLMFEEDSKNSKNLYVQKDPNDEENDKMYSVRIDYFRVRNRNAGVQIFLEDDTKDQKYIRLLDRYNTELEDEVDKKTKRVVEMHNNLVLSMATMVESRDNSTGGHIKRTSEGVRILIDEIWRGKKIHLDADFCKNIIKAAPMHDLGKIAVDDAILRKPGRFTPEEFEIMKKHAAEGAKIVHEILKDTDDESFKQIAENVAHYHHERWDGSGYPEGLKGEEIPLEARIMAIADVYDALVSKRVYKEKMSYDKADAIIMEGMGKHFDEALKDAYVHARPKLEEYYNSLEE